MNLINMKKNNLQNNHLHKHNLPKNSLYKISMALMLALALFASSILTFVSSPEKVMASKKNFVICIDPGHDDTHGRSRLTTSGIHEPTRNLEVARSLKSQLEAYGFTVYMTMSSSACPAPAGTTLQTDCLKWRADYAKSVGADLLISIHHNAATSDKDHWYSASGSVIFISTQYQTMLSNLASRISANLKSYCGLPESTPRGWAKKCTTGDTYSDGTAADYWDLLYYAATDKVPALIVEHGFMDNKYDSSKINSIPASTFAKADCDAIVAWYNEKYGTETTGSKSSGTAAYVNAKDVNLRSSASTSAKTVVKLTTKDTVTLYTKSNGWYYAAACHEGKTYTGFIYCDYVTSGTPSSANSATAGYCNVTSLNVRSQSSTSSSSVVKLVKGDSLKLYELTNGFYRCAATHDGKTYYGYVASSYVAKGTYQNAASSSDSADSDSDDSGSTTASGTAYTITAASVNLRSSNSTSSSIVAVLSKNDKATLISLTGDWAKLNVTHNNKSYTGYVKVNYITKSENVSAGKDTADSTTDSTEKDTGSTIKAGTSYTVTASSVNMRSSYSTDSSVVAILAKGDQGTLISIKGDWAKLTMTHNGKSYTGYVKVNYITKASIVNAASAASDSGTTASSSSGTTDSSAGSGATAATPGDTYKVSASSLNLRSTAAMSGSVVTILSKDDPVTIVSSSTDWAKVTAVHKGKTYSGFVKLAYITKTASGSGSSAGSANTTGNSTGSGSNPDNTTASNSSAASSQTSTETSYESSPKTGIIKGKGVNVRSAAGLDSSKLVKLDTGTSVKVLGYSNGWYKISFTKESKDYTGYVNSGYITVK